MMTGVYILDSMIGTGVIKLLRENDELITHYLTSRSGTIAQVERLLGLNVNGLRLDRKTFPQLYDYFEGDNQDDFTSILREKLPLSE